MVSGLAGIAGSTIGAMAEVRSSPYNADGTLKKGYTQKVDKNGRTFYNSPTLKQQLETCKGERKKYSRAYTKCKQRERSGASPVKGTASKAMTPARAQTARAVSVAVAPANARQAIMMMMMTNVRAMLEPPALPPPRPPLSPQCQPRYI